MFKAPTPPAILPRGLDIRQAARYWGVSPGTFKKLVRLGLAPAPLKLPGIDRHIYDREAIDRAMTSLAATDNRAIKVELESEIVL